MFKRLLHFAEADRSIVEQGTGSVDRLERPQMRGHPAIVLNQRGFPQQVRTFTELEDLAAHYGDLEVDALSPATLDASLRGWIRSHAVALIRPNTDEAILCYVLSARSSLGLNSLRQSVMRRYSIQGEHMVPASVLARLYAGEELRHGASHRAVESPGNLSIHETALKELLHEAMALNATDIHMRLRNSGNEQSGEIWLRVDGELERLRRMPPAELHQLIAVAYARSDEKSLAKGAGQFSTLQPLSSFIRMADTGNVELRFQSQVERYGVDVVLRVLNFNAKHSVKLDLEQLGYVPWQRDLLIDGAFSEGGSVLTSGMPGSGKTTALSALMAMHPEIRSRRAYGCTIEDPPEGRPANVSQFPAGENYLDILRTQVRMDGDIILLGEIRDQSSAQAWREFCLTGHKIFATIHAPSWIGAVSRLCGTTMGLDLEAISSPDVYGIGIHQTLVPRLCSQCRLRAKSNWQTEGLTRKLKLLDDRGLDINSLFVRNYEGCSNCRNGKRGVSVIAEMVKPTLEQRRLISRGEFIDLTLNWRQSRGTTPFTSADMQGKTLLEVAMYFASVGVIGVEALDKLGLSNHELIGGIDA